VNDNNNYWVQVYWMQLSRTWPERNMLRTQSADLRTCTGCSRCLLLLIVSGDGWCELLSLSITSPLLTLTWSALIALWSELSAGTAETEIVITVYNNKTFRVTCLLALFSVDDILSHIQRVDFHQVLTTFHKFMFNQCCIGGYNYIPHKCGRHSFRIHKRCWTMFALSTVCYIIYTVVFKCKFMTFGIAAIISSCVHSEHQQWMCSMSSKLTVWQTVLVCDACCDNFSQRGVPLVRFLSYCQPLYLRSYGAEWSRCSWTQWRWTRIWHHMFASPQIFFADHSQYIIVVTWRSSLLLITYSPELTMLLWHLWWLVLGRSRQPGASVTLTTADQQAKLSTITSPTTNSHWCIEAYRLLADHTAVVLFHDFISSSSSATKPNSCYKIIKTYFNVILMTNMTNNTDQYNKCCIKD